MARMSRRDVFLMVSALKTTLARRSRRSPSGQEPQSGPFGRFGPTGARQTSSPIAQAVVGVTNTDRISCTG